MDPENNPKDEKREEKNRRRREAYQKDEQREEKNRKRREAYQRGKVVGAASMTDEQREEKNKKRRESYKRNKSHAHNKENMPVDFTTSEPITNASDVSVMFDMAEHTSGSALFSLKGANIMSPLNSVDRNIERNKKSRVAYEKSTVETQNKSIPAGDDHYGAAVACTPIDIDDPTSPPFTDNSIDSTPGNMVTPNLSNAYIDVPTGTRSTCAGQDSKIRSIIDFSFVHGTNSSH